MISDIKELTEQIEELNGKYSPKLDEMNVLPDKKEAFFQAVKDVFRLRLETVKEVAPIDLYKFILQQSFYDLAKAYRNFVSKHNKKIIRNRGDLKWNSKNGQYRK